MQASHYTPRQYKATRWEPANVKAACYACNMFYGGRPQEFREKLIEEYGVKEIEALEQMRHVNKCWTRDELLELIEYYKGQL